MTFFGRAFLRYSGDSLLFALLILSFFFNVIVPPEDVLFEDVLPEDVPAEDVLAEDKSFF